MAREKSDVQNWKTRKKQTVVVIVVLTFTVNHRSERKTKQQIDIFFHRKH